MRVELLEEAPNRLIARVELGYALRVDPSVVELPVWGLRFSGALPEGVQASVNGADAPVWLRAAGVRRLEGGVTLPTRDDPTLRLRLRYRVLQRADGDVYRMTVPLILPEAVPIDAPDDFFVTTLRLPAGHAIVEAFPTLRLSRTSQAAAVHHARLQVVPAMLRWRARMGEAPLLRFDRIVDVSALLVLALTVAAAMYVVAREQPP